MNTIHSRHTKEQAMTDRELLELAAKALSYGPDLRWDDKYGCMTDYEGWVFDPLNDDSYCAQIEAALMLDVKWHEQHVTVGRTYFDKWEEPYSRHRTDRQAARRYATVRAAAAIGNRS